VRVGDATLYARFLSGLRIHKQSLSDSLQALADGKRVRSASDDPPGAHASLALRARLTRIEGFDRSAQAARTDLATLDRVLGEITNLLTSARAEAMAGASGDVDDANDVRAGAIDAIRAQVLSLANVQQNGRYLFAGTETLTVPFAQDGTYSGNDAEVQAPIDSNQQVGATLSGQQVFIDGGDLLAHLEDLADALRDNRTDDVGNLIPDLTADLERIIQFHANVGTRMERIDRALERHGDEGVDLARRIAEIEDVDLEEVIVALQEAQVGTDALSAAAARVLGRSLFDYIG
jgi:flagellar hook-associated protein 3 FlgL